MVVARPRLCSGRDAAGAPAPSEAARPSRQAAGRSQRAARARERGLVVKLRWSNSAGSTPLVKLRWSNSAGQTPLVKVRWSNSAGQKHRWSNTAGQTPLVKQCGAGQRVRSGPRATGRRVSPRPAGVGHHMTPCVRCGHGLPSAEGTSPHHAQAGTSLRRMSPRHTV